MQNNTNKNKILLSLLAMSVITTANADELDKKIGRLFLMGFSGTEASKEICSDIKDYNLGGIVLYDTNIKSKKQLRKLTNDLQNCSPNSDLLIAVDQEGGKVQRLKTKYGFYGKFKSAHEVAKMSNKEISKHYLKMAKELKSVGINYNLAPVVDLNLNPNNPIIGGLDRSYSDNSSKVARISNIFINSHEKYGVATSLKHFPGHGSSLKDTHKGNVDVSEEWEKKELRPFYYLRENADSVMTAHVFNKNIDKKFPSSLSKKTLDILRNIVKFDGVIIADDLQMGAVAKQYKPRYLMYLAINAGNDILIFSNQVKKKFKVRIKYLVDEIKPRFLNGDLPNEKLELSIKRIGRLKKNAKIGKQYK